MDSVVPDEPKPVEVLNNVCRKYCGQAADASAGLPLDGGKSAGDRVYLPML